MNPNRVRKPEQIKLIMECRQSGLSDYQWCRKQGITPGTFYNWVSKLRKAEYTIPDPADKISGIPVMQEVVKLELAECGNIRVHIFNGADAAVVQNTFQCIVDMSLYIKDLMSSMVNTVGQGTVQR